MWSEAQRPRHVWEMPFDLSRGDSTQPLFLQIARVLAAEIDRGRLKPGDRLPGTRTLARSLGVNRITVLTAYDELEAEGWIDVRPASGARVAATLPDGAVAAVPNPRPPRRSAAFALAPVPRIEKSPETLRDRLVLASSAPDTRLLPVQALARAYGRVLRGQTGDVLGYGNSAGHPRLRQAVAAMLGATRGIACTSGQVFITRGSQMALTLIARIMMSPGDVVAVEDLGYRHAWESFTRAGATLVPLPVDEDGVSIDALEAALARAPLRAVYVTPHHQFPTTATLSAARRERLLQLAARHRFAIVEDDCDSEFHYDGPAILPLAAADHAGVVIHVGTFSKVLAPGVRIGYIAGTDDLLAHCDAQREVLDLQGDHVVEAAVADLIEHGELQRHVRRVRRMYQRRRDKLAQLLGATLRGAVAVHPASGGVAHWVSVDPAIDVDRWAARAMERGVAFQTARSFTFDRTSRPAARLGFASLTESELTDAVTRLAAALSKSRS